MTVCIKSENILFTGSVDVCVSAFVITILTYFDGFPVKIRFFVTIGTVI